MIPQIKRLTKGSGNVTMFTAKEVQTKRSANAPRGGCSLIRPNNSPVREEKMHSEIPVLKPCPFCQGTNISIEQSGDPDNTSYEVYCRSCYAQGPEQQTKYMAARLWNMAGKK